MEGDEGDEARERERQEEGEEEGRRTAQGDGNERGRSPSSCHILSLNLVSLLCLSCRRTCVSMRAYV